MNQEKRLISHNINDFTDGLYELIYADPPWTFKDKCNAGKRGASHKYNTMTVAELCALPISNLCAANCLLAMWWVAAMPHEALEVVDAWGFKLKTMTGFTWAKKTVNGRDHFGMGHWTRANAENCLIATKGKPKRKSASVRQLITAPVVEHSVKPVDARDRLVQLVGDVPRIELFARIAGDGWDAFGNQVRIS